MPHVVPVESHLDLGYDPAKEWVMKETQRVVGEYHLDYLKHDWTPIVTQCEQTNHRHKYGLDVSYWSALGYYQVQETLKQRFPDVALEGCSSAGHIKDFGVIQRVHYITTTDTAVVAPQPPRHMGFHARLSAKRLFLRYCSQDIFSGNFG